LCTRPFRQDLQDEHDLLKSFLCILATLALTEGTLAGDFKRHAALPQHMAVSLRLTVAPLFFRGYAAVSEARP